MPPFVPCLKGADDLSNFDNFEQSDESGADDVPLLMKNLKSFTGRNLPFVGFSFMRWSEPVNSTMNDEPSSAAVDAKPK